MKLSIPVSFIVWTLAGLYAALEAISSQWQRDTLRNAKFIIETPTGSMIFIGIKWKFIFFSYKLQLCNWYKLFRMAHSSFTEFSQCITDSFVKWQSTNATWISMRNIPIILVIDKNLSSRLDRKAIISVFQHNSNCTSLSIWTRRT